MEIIKKIKTAINKYHTQKHRKYLISIFKKDLNIFEIEEIYIKYTNVNISLAEISRINNTLSIKNNGSKTIVASPTDAVGIYLVKTIKESFLVCIITDPSYDYKASIICSNCGDISFNFPFEERV